MDKEMLSTVNKLIAEQINNSFPELKIIFDSELRWEWRTEDDQSENWYLLTPLDALIDFTQTILMDRDRLIKEYENND